MAEEEIKISSENKPIARPITIPIDLNLNLIYVNGGNIGLSPTEIQFTATVNGRPHSLILLPFPVAKSVAEAILQALKDYEAKTGISITRLKDITTELKK